MPLEVIGAGFGRTGTLSLKAALETLGFRKTHHMREVMKRPRQVRLWHDVGHGHQPDWDEVFSGYRASVDFPSSTYYLALMAHYPDAKVVLTVRDVDRWYHSANTTIFQLMRSMPRWMLHIPAVRRMTEMVDATVWDRLFDGRFADEAHAKRVFTEHNERVRTTVPPDRLLVFEVTQGWEPLCDFLGVPVPDEPFPHMNDNAAFQRRLKALRLLDTAPLAAGVAGAALALRRRRRA